MIALIDNYDSFTYNIYQYISQQTDECVEVFRNDAITVAELQARTPTRVIISPGPGRPENAGISVELVRACAGHIPILGICLGMQAIAAAYGAKIVGAAQVVHGKVAPINFDGQGLFRTLNTVENCTRYHSLGVDERTIPSELEITARAEDGEIMGIRHREHVCEGVQFHPESIGTETGMEMLRNFLHYRRERFQYRALLRKAQCGEELSSAQMAQFMDELTEGNLSDVQIAGLLVAINSKGITADEIFGCASVLRAKALPALPAARGHQNQTHQSKFHIPPSTPILDTCGTGGDGLGTFNISSMSALVVASCGIKVAKHGNKAVSSRSGSSEFFHQLGIPLQITPAEALQLLSTHNFCFLFAPQYHRALRFAATARKELGVKTIMNSLGPLVNPARVSHQLIGISDRALLLPTARAAHQLGVQEIMVVHADDGQDEISISGISHIVRMRDDGTYQESTVDPRSYGFNYDSADGLIGGDASENAALAREIMAGEGHPAIRDSVILNSAAALTLCTPTMKMVDAIAQCRKAISSGAVARTLQGIVSTAKHFSA